MRSRSGTSRSYAERVAKGRPNRTFSLPQDVDTDIDDLAAYYNESRSALICRAIRELKKKRR